MTCRWHRVHSHLARGYVSEKASIGNFEYLRRIKRSAHFPKVSTMRRFRIMVGVLFWGLVASTTARWLQSGDISSLRRGILPEIVQFWAGDRPVIRLHLPAPVEVAVGGAVLVREASGTLRQVGEVPTLNEGRVVLATR